MLIMRSWTLRFLDWPDNIDLLRLLPNWQILKRSVCELQKLPLWQIRILHPFFFVQILPCRKVRSVQDSVKLRCLPDR